MKRIFAIPAIAFLSASLPTLPAAAELVHATCYMKTSSGQIINLGVALCGDTPSSTSGVGNTAAFLAEFNREAVRRASPDIRSLMALDSKTAQSMVEYAKLYCDGRKLGSTDRELRRTGRAYAQDGSRAGRASALTFEISNDLAPKHFCPEFAR
jgi:hypothetical protein